ncbi:MAG TPA: S9 family peptidase [Candidatus Acidoferrales bacterium]
MKAARVVFCALALLSVTLTAGASSLEQILKYRELGDLELSPDGARAVFVVTVTDLDENTVNPDLWLVELVSGRHFQLTQSPKRDTAPAWSPDGKRIAFLSDRGGKTNIWLIAPDGGEAEPATRFEKLSVSAFRWLPDGSGFLFTAADPPTEAEEKRRRDKEDFTIVGKTHKLGRLYLFKLGDKEPTLLTQEDYHVTEFDVAPDGRSVVFAAQATPGFGDFVRSDLYGLELASRSVRTLLQRPGLDAAPRFSPDGRWIAFISNFGHKDWSGNVFIGLIRPDGSGLRNLTETFDERLGFFVSSNHVWSGDGKWIYYTAGQGAAVRLFRVEVETGKWEAAAPEDAEGVNQSFSLRPDARVAVAVFSDPQTPAEVYRLDLARGGRQPLTRINADLVGTAPVTELLRYRSPDGLDIEGLVIKPKDFQPGKRYPLLVIVHGGPAIAYQLSFLPRTAPYPVHAFTDLGYVVWLPNPRGSGSYGERFRQANIRDWGGGDYRDILQGVDILIERGVADPDRLGVMGSSYGGYMTSWVVSQTTRFKAASMGAAVTNLFSMYGTTDIPEGMEAPFGKKPWKDPDLYLSHSAIRFVAQAKTPTLIQHGEEDTRVPISQAQEFHQGLKDVGVPVEMIVYPRQGHRIQEPRLVKAAMQHNLDWFNWWVLGIEPRPAEKKEENKAE